MRILVTGATGFIGWHLCRALRVRGHEVRALVRPGAAISDLEALGVERRTGDVTVPASLPHALEGIEAVAHLAGVLNASRDSTYDRVNREGTMHLAVACHDQALRRFAFVSSLAAQGPSAPGHPHRHAGDEHPYNAYGRSKLAAEAILRREAAEHGLPVTILRPATVYGPRDPEVAAWGRLARLRLLPIVDGMEMCFLHVEDLVSLVADVLERDDAPVGPFFVSDGECHRMERVADLVERLAGAPPALRLPLSPGLLELVGTAAERLARATGIGALAARSLGELRASGWACVPDEAREALGFEPRHHLADGLPEVFAWYRAHGWI